MNHELFLKKLTGLVIVIGAGATGIAAAITAARNGANVLLLERNASLGGTVTNALIHTIGGLYNSTGRPINKGIVTELADRLSRSSELVRKRKIGRTWVLAISPEEYGNVVTTWVDKMENVSVLKEAVLTGISVKNQRISDLTFVTGGQEITKCPSAVVDATGSAEVALMAGQKYVTEENNQTLGGLVFILKNVQVNALNLTGHVALIRKIRRAVYEKKLPEQCSNLWLDTGFQDDEVYVKMSVPITRELNIPGGKKAMLAQATTAINALLGFLKSEESFSNAYLQRCGSLGIRRIRQIIGEYTLTRKDVIEQSRFSDFVCRCSWPIENWNLSSGLELKYLPDNGFYEIPYGSLKVKGINNLWSGGKCLSADEWAQSSARVVGACWSMGEAAGKAAASYAGAE